MTNAQNEPVEVTQADRDAANVAFDIAFRGDTNGIDLAMAKLFARHRTALSDVVTHLVIAARELVFSDHRPIGAPETQAEVEFIDLFDELDKATEAFAELVPWNDQSEGDIP